MAAWTRSTMYSASSDTWSTRSTTRSWTRNELRALDGAPVGEPRVEQPTRLGPASFPVNTSSRSKMPWVRCRSRRPRSRSRPTSPTAPMDLWRTRRCPRGCACDPLGELPGSVVIYFATIDAIAHAWDLSHQLGRSIEIDPAAIPRSPMSWRRHAPMPRESTLDQARSRCASGRRYRHRAFDVGGRPRHSSVARSPIVRADRAQSAGSAASRVSSVAKLLRPCGRPRRRSGSPRTRHSPRSLRRSLHGMRRSVRCPAARAARVRLGGCGCRESPWWSGCESSARSLLAPRIRLPRERSAPACGRRSPAGRRVSRVGWRACACGFPLICDGPRIGPRSKVSQADAREGSHTGCGMAALSTGRPGKRFDWRSPRHAAPQAGGNR